MGICWSDPPQPPPVQTISPAASPCRGCGLWENRPGGNDYCHRCVQVVQPQYTYAVAYTQPQMNTFQVNVRTLTGTNLPIWTSSFETVFQLKQRIQMANGVLPQQQVLIYMGKQMEDQRPLNQYNIQQGHTVHLVLRLT